MAAPPQIRGTRIAFVAIDVREKMLNRNAHLLQSMCQEAVIAMPQRVVNFLYFKFVRGLNLKHPLFFL